MKPPQCDYTCPNLKCSTADTVYCCKGVDTLCELCEDIDYKPTEAAYHEYPDSSSSIQSRSKIFSAGCIQWSWGLADTSDKTGKVTKNIIDGLASTFRGHITQNRTWSGNIYLGGDVTVDSGVTVTINPGTKIYFFPNNDVERTGGNSTKTELIVKGTLICVGTQLNPIILTSSSTNPANGDWGGVLVAFPGRANIEFTSISYADTAIVVTGDTATVRVRNSTFTHFNTMAVYSIGIRTDLGVVVNQDCGKNNIFMNTATSGAKAFIKTATPAVTQYADGNWWSTANPSSEWFSNVHHFPNLTGIATPDSCPADSGGGGDCDGPACRVVVDAPKPVIYSLSQNYPNPFNPATVIRYSLPEATRVELRIFNILGQPVRALLDTELPAGVYESLWEGDDNTGRKVSSGTCFYQLRTKDFVQSKKMLLVK